jgi:serine/threonine protein kinase
VATGILPERYRRPERIGMGGMGEIYRATDSTLGRTVAIKVLSERYAGDDSVRERFTREALAAARLSGEPNTVTIYDVGEHERRPYIVMEFLGGGSLEDVLEREGAQPPLRVFDWLEQAGRALDTAHEKGVVHRDVKPGNLMLDGEGNVHVADFGIASAAGMESLTMTGTVMGTSGYLSPEQAQGERATPASDRYALAVVGFELLTGRRPFQADTPTAEAFGHVHAEVPSIARDGLPRELDPVFRKALAKDPADRYGTSAEFVAALRAATANAAGATSPLRPVASLPTTATRPLPPVRGRRTSRSPLVWPALVGLLLLGALGGGLLAYFLTHGSGGKAAPQPSRSTRTVTVQGQATTVVSTVLPTTSTTAPAPATDGHTLNDQGFAKMGAGDYAGALPLLREAVQKLSGTGPDDPYEGYANYNLGYTLLQLGQCEEAIPYLQQADHLEHGRHEPHDALERAKKCAKGH